MLYLSPASRTAAPAPLDHEHESLLLDGVRGGCRDALDGLVQRHLGFVVRVAREYERSGIPREDLIGAGCVGLLEAARRYEPDRGARFLTYAAWWVRKSMLALLDAQMSIVRITSYQRRIARGGSPAPLRVQIVSLDAPSATGADQTFGERLPDGAAPDPERATLAADEHRRLRRALRRLPARERLVVVRSFGLDGEPSWSRQDIGVVIGLSRERVRQIEETALARLRRWLSLGSSPSCAAPASR